MSPLRLYSSSFPIIRKDVDSLSPSEQDQLINVFSKLRGRSKYTEMISHHRRYCEHRTSRFPLWHMAYLACFEKMMVESGSGGIGVPFWDWNIHPEYPLLAKNEVFTLSHMIFVAPINHPEEWSLTDTFGSKGIGGMKAVESRVVKDRFLGRVFGRRDLHYGIGFTLENLKEEKNKVYANVHWILRYDDIPHRGERHLQRNKYVSTMLHSSSAPREALRNFNPRLAHHRYSTLR